MIHAATISVISFLTMSVSMIAGYSENAALFGTILAVGYYSANVKEKP